MEKIIDLRDSEQPNVLEHDSADLVFSGRFAATLIPRRQLTIVILVACLALVGLLILDGYYARLHNLNRLSGHTFFHVLLLAAVLFRIWYTNVGLIL